MISRIAKLIISLVYFVLKKATRIFSAKGIGGLVIVTYHSVKREERPLFAKHMDEAVKVGQTVFADSPPPTKRDKHLIAVTFDDGFRSFVDHALPLLNERNIPATIFITTGYIGQRPGWITRNDNRNYDELVMTKMQISELGSCNILMGSHSVTHRHLGSIRKKEVQAELALSKRDLEEITGQDIHLFSFPYGSYNSETINLAKTEGYKRIFLNVPKKPGRNSDDIVFGRIDISLRDWPIEYKLKFRGGYEWLSCIFMIKKKLKKYYRAFCVFITCP